MAIIFSPFAVMGVEKHASVDEIRSAYCGLIRNCHKENLTDLTEEKLEKFREQVGRLAESFRVLVDPNLRRLFYWYSRSNNEDHLKLAWEEVQKNSKGCFLSVDEILEDSEIKSLMQMERYLINCDKKILKMWIRRNTTFRMINFARVDLVKLNKKMKSMDILIESGDLVSRDLSMDTYKKAKTILKECEADLERVKASCPAFRKEIEEIKLLTAAVNSHLNLVVSSWDLVPISRKDLSDWVVKIKRNINDFLVFKEMKTIQTNVQQDLLLNEAKIRKLKKDLPKLKQQHCPIETIDLTSGECVEDNSNGSVGKNNQVGVEKNPEKVIGEKTNLEEGLFCKEGFLGDSRAEKEGGAEGQAGKKRGREGNGDEYRDDTETILKRKNEANLLLFKKFLASEGEKKIGQTGIRGHNDDGRVKGVSVKGTVKRKIRRNNIDNLKKFHSIGSSSVASHWFRRYSICKAQLMVERTNAIKARKELNNAMKFYKSKIDKIKKLLN